MESSQQYTDKKHSRSITEHYIHDNVSQVFHRVEWGLRYGGYMLENTLGGSGGREAATFVFGDTFLYERRTLLSAACPAAVKTWEVELETWHGPWYYPALELLASRLFSFILTLTRAQLRTHTYRRCHILYSFVLDKHFKGVSWPLAATLSRNNRVDVVVARQPLNKWACDWLSTLPALCGQLHETLCTNMHTLQPPYQCFSCLCPSSTLYHITNCCSCNHWNPRSSSFIDHLQAVLHKNWSWLVYTAA